MVDSIMSKGVGRYSQLYEKYITVKEVIDLGFPRSLLMDWAISGKIAPWKTDIDSYDGQAGKKVLFTFYCPNKSRPVRWAENTLPDDEAYNSDEFLSFIEDTEKQASQVQRVRKYLLAQVEAGIGRLPQLESNTSVLGENFGLTAKPEDYERAFRQKSWTAREALCWLKGRNPDWCREDIEEYYREESDLVRRAISAGILTWKSSTPRQWIEWWKETGFDIPAAMERCDKFLKLKLDLKAPGESKSRGYIEECRNSRSPTQKTSEGRPAERRNCWRPIWVMLGRPRRNDKIWNELKARQNKDDFPVVKVLGNDEFEFRYDTGDTERLTRKVFQNDMGDIRKEK
jgi:hypothetical protein